MPATKLGKKRPPLKDILEPPQVIVQLDEATLRNALSKVLENELGQLLESALERALQPVNQKVDFLSERLDLQESTLSELLKELQRLSKDERSSDAAKT